MKVVLTMTNSHTASLIWITPNAEQTIVDCARVSNPKNQGKDGTRLLKFLVDHQHWSPFEMASACFEIRTSRAIARQILRHRSFSFQEFSQRYATIDEVKPILTPARMAGATNRQSSIETSENDPLHLQWLDMQYAHWDASISRYKAALSDGIAPEVARVLLPEGMTPSVMYMTGTLRSWIHYVGLRTGEDTQHEHQLIASKIGDILSTEMPFIGACWQ